MITYDNSRAVGNVGEAVAIAEFTKKNIPVFLPFGQNTPVDLLIFINDQFKKIQVKTTKSIKNGTMEFEMCRTNGFTLKKTPYTSKDTDYFYLYCIENKESYLISQNEIGEIRTVTIRIDKPKNNQKKGVRYSSDYNFEKQINELVKTS